MMSASQLDWFGSQDVHQLRTENAYLKERLESAKVAYRKLCDELQEQRTVQRELERCQQDLTQWQSQARFWQSQAGIFEYLANCNVRAPAVQLPGPSKADLTSLLTLCHPDKWLQDQPATTLAHELTIAINRLRERLGVQP